MEFVDTHTHLFAEEFDSDRDAVIDRAKQARVKTMLLPNIDAGSVSQLKLTCVKYTENCLPMMGLHPCSVQVTDYKNQLEIIKKEYFSDDSYIGVGEIGIDLYWDKSTVDIQKEAFVEQCRWAIEKEQAVSIHTRSATYETIACLKSLPKPPMGVFHCFSGSFEEAVEIIRLGMKLGIGGVVTYKNAGLPSVLEKISPENLVLETDAPYLPPVPFRGKRNESSYIPYIAEKLAGIYGITVQEIADITTATAKSVFGF